MKKVGCLLFLLIQIHSLIHLLQNIDITLVTIQTHHHPNIQCMRLYLVLLLDQHPTHHELKPTILL